MVGDVVTVEYPEVVCLASVIEITIEDGRDLVGEGIITGDCSGLAGNVRTVGEEESIVGFGQFWGCSSQLRGQLRTPSHSHSSLIQKLDGFRWQ